MLKSIKKNNFTILTLAPALILLFVFVFFPSIYSVFISFFRTHLLSIDRFVGFENYASILANHKFWLSLENTIYYTVGSVAGTLVIGFLLALLLEKNLRGKAFFRGAFFMPYIIPYAGYALIWYWIYDPRSGLVNYLLGWIGVSPIPWLTSPSWVIPAFILMSIWKRMGFAMVLFLAGLLTIPDDLNDAATVDGVTWLSRIRHVTLPLLRPVTLFISVISIIYSFQLFIEPFVMTKGGPANASQSVVYQLYSTGFRGLNFGLASAMAVILFLIIFAVTLLLIRSFKVEELY
jgi:multiple sugar transport system permease protein